MVIEGRDKVATLYYRNYNFSYEAFFAEYSKLGISIISTRDILKINKLIFAFISSYNYTIVDEDLQKKFLDDIYKQNIDIKTNEKLQKIQRIMQLGVDNFKDKIQYYGIYYDYLIEQLYILGAFSEAIADTIMPSKEGHKKYIDYTGNTTIRFVQCVADVAAEVNNNIKEFAITTFVETYSSILVYYYAFYLFIEERKRIYLEEMLSIILSQVINTSTAKILNKYPNFNKNDIAVIRKLEYNLFMQINYINSKINESFSNFGIFPKISKRIYLDKTLV